MFITRIEIKNFKSIKSIDINLKANKTGIENDVAVGKFDKTGVPGIIAFIGRNSVGKTTIIEALSFVKKIGIEKINDKIINKIFYNEWKAKIKHNHKNKSSQDDSFLNTYKERSKIKKTIKDQIHKKEGEYFDKYIEKFEDWLKEYFKKSHNNIEKEIKFEIHFLKKDEKQGIYLISLDNEGNLKKEIKGQIKLSEYKEYFENTILIQNKTNSWKRDHDIEKSLEDMLEMVDERKTTNLLKLCDENIDVIKFSKLAKNSWISIRGINLNTRKVQIQPKDLSNGTKQFVILVSAIVKAYKNKKNYGLLVFDEIELSLHNELVQSLMHMLISLFRDLNIQSIITTHNLMSLQPLLSYKQIFSIEKYNQDHEIIKAASIMKPHENILTKLKQGLIAYHPDPELIRNTTADFIYELKSK